MDGLFADLMLLRRCTCRVHWFTPGVEGREFLQNGDRCSSLGHWSLISSGRVALGSLSVSALHAACRDGRPDTIELLLTHYAVPMDAATDGKLDSPLITACEHGQRECGTVLLRHGATDTIPAAKVVPVWVASALGDVERLQELEGGDIDGASTTDSRGRYPLHIACRNGNVACTEWLLAHGASVNRPMSNGTTPLHLACTRDHVDCARLLLDAGADIEGLGCEGKTTPLWNACSRGNAASLELLLARGADTMCRSSGSARTPLHVACQHGHVSCVRTLLRSPTAWALSSARDRAERTAVMTASEMGRPDCLASLLQLGVDVNLADGTGMSALIIASRKGHVACVCALLDAGANVDHQERSGRRALDRACASGAIDCARLLLDAGADVNLASNSGRTPLFSACIANERACAALLLERGADTALEDAFGQTAAYVARGVGIPDEQLAAAVEQAAHDRQAAIGRLRHLA